MNNGKFAAIALLGVISVAPAFAQDDIAAQVQAEIHRSAALTADALQVRTAGSTVYVSGTVDTTIEQNAIDQIVARLANGKIVVNDTTLSSGGN